MRRIRLNLEYDGTAYAGWQRQENALAVQEVLEKALLDVKAISDLKQCAEFYRDTVIVAMNELRAVADELETLVSREYWPFPTYGDLLFGVV